MKKRLSIVLAIVLALAMMLPAAAMAETYVKATASVNVRTGPGSSHDLLGSIRSGATLPFAGSTTYDRAGGLWIRVEYGSEYGWVYGDYVTFTDSKATVGTDANGKSGYITATGKLNVRKGPGLDYDTMGSIKEGATLTYLGSSSQDNRGVNWYQVSYNNKTGWVSAMFSELTTTGGNGSGNGNGGNGYMTCVQATGKDYLYDTPVKDSHGKGPMYKGERYRLISSKYDKDGLLWYQVEYEMLGYMWVSSKYTKLVNNSLPYYDNVSGHNVYYRSGSSYCEATANVYVRESANLTANDLVLMREGSTASYLGRSTVDSRGITWYKVSYDGKTGWVSARYTDLYKGN